MTPAPFIEDVNHIRHDRYRSDPVITLGMILCGHVRGTDAFYQVVSFTPSKKSVRIKHVSCHYIGGLRLLEVQDGVRLAWELFPNSDPLTRRISNITVAECITVAPGFCVFPTSLSLNEVTP